MSRRDGIVSRPDFCYYGRVTDGGNHLHSGKRAIGDGLQG